MSIELRDIVSQYFLSPSDFVVLYRISDRTNKKDGFTFVSPKRLIKECQISRRTLYRSLKHLEHLGLLERFQGADNGRMYFRVLNPSGFKARVKDRDSNARESTHDRSLEQDLTDTSWAY